MFRILTEAPPILAKTFITCFVPSFVGMTQNACTLVGIKFHRNPVDMLRDRCEFNTIRSLHALFSSTINTDTFLFMNINTQGTHT